MSALTDLSPRFRLQRYLTAGYALFIVYASLSPFSGWQEQGLYFSEVLIAPLDQTFTWFDFTLNALSYLPLGFLLAYLLRNRWPACICCCCYAGRLVLVAGDGIPADVSAQPHQFQRRFAQQQYRHACRLCLGVDVAKQPGSPDGSMA